MFRIAIQPDNQLLTSGRYQSFSDRWVEKLQEAGHEPHLVDASRPDFCDQVATCNGFMWWYAHLAFPRNFAKRVVPAVEHGFGIPVFPTWHTTWHFDDKIAQTYLLQAAGIPMPRTWVFWSQDEAIEFCRGANYPLVLKLSSGITSENVRLLRDFGEARRWIKRMFGPGLTALGSPPLNGPTAAAKRARDFLLPLLKGLSPRPGSRTGLQKGYLLVQEFVPGNEFDTRVTVIGNRAFGFRRLNRPNDFRASGSGRIEFDPAAIDPESVRLAFKVARRLDTQSLAVDVLYQGGERVLTEISYYYEGWALHACPGHWELRGDAKGGRLDWVEGQIRPEDAILEDFLARLEQRIDAASAYIADDTARLETGRPAGLAMLTRIPRIDRP